MATEPTVVFLDANVLAKPVTRTLLIVGAPPSDLRVTWSRHVEREADRHRGVAKVPVTDLRSRFGWRLSPPGTGAEHFVSTSEKDRQVLADAVSAGASYLVSEDVDDFAPADLVQTGISVVNPDLFMAIRFTRDGYVTALDTLTTNRTRPPSTPPALHAAIAKRHPLLFAAFVDLYDVAPEASDHNPPAEVFRGPRCLRCGELAAEPAELCDGLHETCQP